MKHIVIGKSQKIILKEKRKAKNRNKNWEERAGVGREGEEGGRGEERRESRESRIQNPELSKRC